MTATAELVTAVKELQNRATRREAEMDTLTKNFNTLLETLKKTPAPGINPNGMMGSNFGAPNIINGERTMGSRGFSFMKMIGMITGDIEANQCKVERDVHNRLTKAVAHGGDLGASGYEFGGSGFVGEKGGKFLAPLATSYFQDQFVNRDFRYEMKSLVAAGCDGADLDHMKWIRTKQLNAMGYGTKALSWLNELTGGALVAPPEMGELIELLRNKEALVNAGARVVPLPPQGRLKYPRQTGPSNTYWLGESSPIPDSNLGTGEVTLQAKKLCVLIKAPNELIRFASPAAEALMRDDMTKSLALGLDLAGLEGLGGDTRPLGIIQRQNINRIVSSKPQVNGDEVRGEDIYRMVAAVEESNAEFECFVMRPKTLYKFYQLRTDAVSQGDRSGQFLFSLIREATESAPATLAGFPVVKSTQVSQVRNKVAGAGSNLTYILGGMFSDVLIGMFGAIEFAATTQGDTSFAYDQTWVRGILSADIAIRHEAAMVLLDNLDTTLPNAN